MKSILIRTEDKNIWEKRTPLTPDDLREVLMEVNTTAYVQTSGIRVFTDDQYKSNGAIVCDEINCGDIIIGIKEVPEDKILDNKIYMFFSHTIKGQKSNMPLLKRIIEQGSTLIDYEKILDENDKRLIYFGNYAGDAGVIDILWLLGEYWKHHGIDTPFSKCKQSINYASLDEAKKAVYDIADIIKSQGIHCEITPMIVGILGYGNVASGAKEILNCLPVRIIKPEELSGIVENGQSDNKTVYVCEFKQKDLVKNKNGKEFDLKEYYEFPERYENDFEKYLPYLSVIINGLYWDKKYPNFVTWNGLYKVFKNNKKARLNGIADISGDINGAIECNVKNTSISDPAYLVNPITKEITDGWLGDGIVLMSVDNLPAELSHDASVFFSERLKKILPSIIKGKYENSLYETGLPKEIQKAVIVYKGELMPEYEYLRKFI